MQQFSSGENEAKQNQSLEIKDYLKGFLVEAPNTKHSSNSSSRLHTSDLEFYTHETI